MKRNKFSLSHYKLFSMNMGTLYPCGLTEALVGDSIQHSTSMLVRASPLNAPVMHPVDIRIHHWAVPMRVIWNEWEDFITGGPDNSNASVFPTITLDENNAAVGSLADYLGCPPCGVGESYEVSALPFRAYAEIFNQHYRDQDLVQELPVSYDSGPDTTTNTDLLNVAWEKDYFTSARPWEQKGPSITLPIGDRAPVRSDAAVSTTVSVMDSLGANVDMQTGGANLLMGNTPQAAQNALYADIAQSTGITINDLREFAALQRYAENRARFGSRFVEYARYLGVRSSDARLQRPEYLGGGRNTLQFSEILQTAEGASPVGEMRGHGIAAMRSNRYRRFFEEHMYILSLASVRPKTIYNNSLARTWTRRLKEDFWQQELQHIGQQEVFKQEVYAKSADPKGVFGYQDRYDEYRRQESTVAGDYRNDVLNYWHMARDFATEPALNADFATCVPTERIFAETNPAELDVLYCMAKHRIQARRLVSKTGRSYLY